MFIHLYFYELEVIGAGGPLGLLAPPDRWWIIWEKADYIYNMLTIIYLLWLISQTHEISKQKTKTKKRPKCAIYSVVHSLGQQNHDKESYDKNGLL